MMVSKFGGAAQLKQMHKLTEVDIFRHCHRETNAAVSLPRL